MSESLFNRFENDDLTILHVEVGAGSGKFGEKFHKECYLTEIDSRHKKHVHYICSAMDLPWTDARFDLVIACNPFEYGFASLEAGKALLAEFLRVLRPPGRVLIIGHEQNPWCDIDQIQSTVQHFIESQGIKIQLQAEVISPGKEYPGHTFQTCGVAARPTFPNRRYTILIG